MVAHTKYMVQTPTSNRDCARTTHLHGNLRPVLDSAWNRGPGTCSSWSEKRKTKFRLPYCTTRRNGKIDFFYRLPAPPRRLDLSQDVLRTTEWRSDRSGGARCILGRVVKSPAARARRTLFSTKIVRACTILVLACTILVGACTSLLGACTSLVGTCTSFSTCTSLVGAKY